MTPYKVDVQSNESMKAASQPSIDGDETTKIVCPEGSSPYIHCVSTERFSNPISSPGSTAAEINARVLNLNLGQTLLKRDNKKIIETVWFLNKLLVSWWEGLLFTAWNKVPMVLRRKITFTAWKCFFPLHKWLLGNKTGIHPAQSLQYHALTTCMWAGRFFPVTVPRMRFALNQLTASTPTDIMAHTSEQIDEEVFLSTVPDCQKEHCRVKGLYLHRTTEPTDFTLLWVYGGAFLSGDAVGNSGPADVVGDQCGMDVFVPTYRLAPEYNIEDILWDIALSYRWLYTKRKVKRQDPSKILMFGCSSGAALCTRLLQFFAELDRGEELLPKYIAPLLQLLQAPKGAVLASPYVCYLPKDASGSFMQYNKHDLIVNEPVLEVGLPFLDTHMCGKKKEHSPVHRSFAGLPPLCVVVSEHEVVYDETVELINAARDAGVHVTVGMWKYMCHVWCLLGGFIPEGKQANDFLCNWMNQQQKLEHT